MGKQFNSNNHSQSDLPGFFDPALGEEKMLHVIYNYHEQPHEVTIRDNEYLRLPKTCKYFFL